MVEVNVLPKVGTDNGVATHLKTVQKYSKHAVVNWTGTGNGVVNIQAIGSKYPKIDVFTAHSYYADEQARTPFGKNANKRLLNNAKQSNRIICVSKYVQDFLIKNGIDKHKTVIIRNPVDIAEIDGVIPSKRKLPKKFSLYIGDKEVKRPGLFVDLAKAFPQEKFVAIGLPKDLNPPKNVTVLPKLPRDQVLKIIKKCNLFLLLSKRESCPYALLEAMAMKKVCIASNYAGQKEIIKNNFNGFLFKFDNLINLCNVFRLASNGPYKDIRNNARLTIDRQFNARIQVPKIDSVYVRPKVSIITYVYCTEKNGRYKQLLEAIASVRDQGFKSYEHIIIDDGSTVPLHDKLTNPNIRYYWKPNTGITKTTETFNMGFWKAQGKYAMILPSDDLHMRNTMQILSAHLDKHPKLVAVAGNYIDQRYRDGNLRSEKKVIRRERNIKNELLRTNCVNAIGCMFRMDAWDKITPPPDDTGFASDYDLWMRLSEVGSFTRISDCVVFYRCFSNATRFQTQKDMAYRTKCVNRVLFTARKRRGIR